ncbi:MAG: hypothetical protein JWM14_828 [Chitinophagaceae bacterium]|nr:hypothetical protein [Chitinophagaceae bacterium]
MSNLQETIQDLLNKKLEITLSGKTYNLHVIDWKKIADEHEDVMEQTEGMDDEEVGEFLCDHETELIQITEYFMNDACDEKVEDDKWLPFGLLGLSHHPDHYAETNHEGLLLLDISKGKQDHPTVILFKKDKAQIVAASVEELDIRTVN